MDKIELLIGLTLSETDKEYSENEKLKNCLILIKLGNGTIYKQIKI